MGIETTALTDFAALADPSAAPAARPGNPDFAPFLSIAADATAAPTPAAPATPALEETLLANLPTPGINVVTPPQIGVGKPTPADVASALPTPDGQEDPMLQSAFNIVQQLGSAVAKPAPAPVPAIAPLITAGTPFAATPAPVTPAPVIPNSAPTQPSDDKTATAAAPGFTLPAPPSIKPAAKTVTSGQAEDASDAKSDDTDEDADPAPMAIVLPAPIAITAPPAVAQPAPVAAAIVSQDQDEADATPLPPRAAGRPAIRAAAEQLAVTVPTTPLPAAPASDVATPVAPTATPDSPPAPIPTDSAPATAERPAANAQTATAPLPTTTAAAATVAVASTQLPAAEKPADRKVVDAAPIATPSDIAGAAPLQQHTAAPAAAPVTNAAPASPAPLAVGPAIARALDDLIVSGASDDQWVHRLASDIQTLANGDRREAYLQLRPQELGSMAIKLEMEDRQTRVHFTVDNAAAKDLIADAAPRLQHLVEARGYRLDQTTVEVSRPSDTANTNTNSFNGNSNSGASAGTGSGAGRQSQQGADPQNFRAPRGAAASEAAAAARALASGKFERFA